MNRLMKQTGFLFGGKVSEDGGQYMPRIITYIALNGTKDIETRIEKLSVFDWWGCPIKQYDLGVNIMDIIIDESSKTGYVIYRDDEYEYHLGNFDL